MMPFDEFFTSSFGKKKKSRRPYRMGRPPEQRPPIAQNHGPKISQDEWRAMSHSQKMAALNR